jgi:oxygen-dependent protoporphyrinogen oxidase
MIGIIGAGIAGLTTAYHLQKAGLPYRLLEERPGPGGYVRSVREGPYLRELGPNSLLCDSELLRFIGELGLGKELLPANAVSKARYIYRDGAYRVLPTNPLQLLFSSFFSWETKEALWAERSNASRSPAGETVGAFFERRFSKELVDYALAPFVAGIYAGDPYELLVNETFPSLVDYERRYGSVLRGFLKNRRSGRSKTVSFRNGLQTLTDTLAAQLHAESLRYETSVRHVRRTEAGWWVETSQGDFDFDQLVITSPAFACADFLEADQPDFAAALRAVRYPPMVLVHTVFKRADVRHPLNGFGGLNPKVEGLFTAGHIWNSSLFDGRCPRDEVLLTSFVGGAQSVDNARYTDREILQKVTLELRYNFGIRPATPVYQQLFRWDRSIPQYDAAALDAQRFADAAAARGMYFCVNWKGGVSFADGFRKGKKLAAQLTAS